MRKLFFLFLIIIIPNILFSESRKEIVLKLFKSIEYWYGTTYKLGGKTKDGVDCANFVAQVYKEVFDIEIPVGVTNQTKTGKLVKDRLEPGDILFFKITDRVSHVGIYLFNNKFVHSASEGEFIGVRKNSLNEKYFKDRFAYAKRIIDLPSYNKNDTAKENLKDMMIIGKNIYYKKVFNLSLEFTEKDTVYIQVKSKKNDKGYLLDIENMKGQKLKMVEIIPSDNSNIQKLFLKKGNYKIKLENTKKNLIEEKNIVIK